MNHLSQDCNNTLLRTCKQPLDSIQGNHCTGESPCVYGWRTDVHVLPFMNQCLCIQSPMLLSFIWSCTKTTHPHMEKQAHTHQIPYMLADAIDMYNPSGRGQHSSIQHDAPMLTYTHLPPRHFDSRPGRCMSRKDCMLIGRSNPSIFKPGFISHIRSYLCHVDLVERREQATCAQWPIREYRASYLCAVTHLRVQSKLHARSVPFESTEQATCAQRVIWECRASYICTVRRLRVEAGYICASCKHVVCREPVNGCVQESCVLRACWGSVYFCVYSLWYAGAQHIQSVVCVRACIFGTCMLYMQNSTNNLAFAAE